MSISIIEILRQKPVSSKELQLRTGLSQASVSRQLNSLGDSIVKLGSGRSTQYVLVKNAFETGDRIPLYAVDAQGSPVCIANIRPLAHGGFYVERTTNTPAVLLGEQGNGLYDDLPYFLDDLRPQGFIGRQIARALSESSNFPSDPRQWTAEHVGSYLIANSDDLPGNIKLGRQSLMRIPGKILPTQRSDYYAIADLVIQGDLPGSSAGGEQPKFTAFTEDRGHVIVKFSPPGGDNVARRWRDILLSEYHAHKILRENIKISLAVESEIFEIGDRLFLESQRFDRHGVVGRLPMISLMVVDAEFVGEGTNWPGVMDVLTQTNLVSAEHYFDACLLHEFGKAINNTDMHLGNLSLSYDGDVFRLLPIYDMCSMGFAPTSSNIPGFGFTYNVDNYEGANYKDIVSPNKAAIDVAVQYWQAVSADERISEEMKNFLEGDIPIKFR